MASPLVSALKNPRFLKLWAGQCVSALGDRFTQLALLSLVMARDTSWEQAKLDFWFYLPWLLFGPFAGVLVDRLSRKTLMIWADLIRAGLVLTLFAFGLGRGADLSGTYPVLLAMGLMTCVFSPAKSASLPDLVEPAAILPSGALLAATGVMATAVGGLIAGQVIKHWGWRACLAFDAVTFLVSAAAVWAIAFPPRAARAPSSVAQVLSDLGEGFREIRRNAELGKICAFLFVFWFAANSVKVISPNFAKEALGVGEGDIDKVTLILAVAGIGLLAGAGATAALGHRISRRAAYLVAAGGMGGAILALAFSSTMSTALFFLFLAGCSGGTLVSRIEADILKVIAPAVRGRVFGATSVLFAAAILSPLLPIGWLSKHMPASVILGMLSSLLLALGGVLAVRLREGKP